MARTVDVALVEGDGAAPEMMHAARAVVARAAAFDNVALNFVSTPMGWNTFEQYGDTLPKSSLERATEIGLLFFGGVGDPALDKSIGKNYPNQLPEAKALLTIRNLWQLLLNFRPVIYYPELAHLAKVRPETIPPTGVEQIFVRFLLQDSYFGNVDLFNQVDSEVRQRIGLTKKADVTGQEPMLSELSYYRRETIIEYFRQIFVFARQRNLPVISIDKANVMARYLYWRKIATEVGESFPDVPLQHQLVDSANALLFEPSKLHGVIACGNEHGDILSDGAAGGVGSLGLMCSSAINPTTGAAMFESGAGTAPTLAGKNRANPIGRILSGALLLHHINAHRGGVAIEKAVRQVLQDGYRTDDIVQVNAKEQRIVGTEQMAEAIINRLVP